LYLALIFSLPTQGLLLLYLYCVEFISNISFASIHISFSLFAMLVTYLCGVAVYRYVLSRYIV
jgi:hypothetical protein